MSQSARRTRPLEIRLPPFRVLVAITLVAGVMSHVLACSSPGVGDPPVAQSATLGGERVARCGGEEVSAASVAAVASARQVSPRDAVDLLIGDACLAEGAKRRDLPPSFDRAVEERRVLSRAMLTSIVRGPVVTAAIRDDEVAAIRAQRWRELDHDAAARVVHAVAMFPEKGPRDADALRGLIGRIAAAVQGATDAADFRQRAKAAIAGDPLEKQVRVESLDPVVPDGRTLSGDAAAYEKAFAEAAGRLKNTHEISQIVETSFGLHVLMLLEIVPALHVPEARIRELATPEIRANRGRTELTALLQRLHRESSSQVMRDADDLLSKVRLGGTSLAAAPPSGP